MVLPEPLWSDDDIKVVMEVIRDPSNLISSTWSKDPTKLAILRALDSCQARPGRDLSNVASALLQKLVCFLHSYSLEVEEVH